MDPSGSSTFTLGMRVSGGKAAFYMNDVKYIEMDTYRGTKTCTEVGSPILLWNNNLHCTFDNLIVTTADYNLFNESAEAEQQTPVATEAPANDAPAATDAPANDNPADAPAATDAPADDQGADNTPADNTPAAGATELVVETERVVVGTDSDGNDVTEVVTREVARPAANTGTRTTGGSAARTGDMAVVVVAVMIAAVGSALVVRRISFK
jgi:hypothetical protein